ncbi:hypothetical protein CEUSTIGMA_g931.t1 [Chlamydomonas eustigma]|uniref:Protein kinase domain-containing protein n=1 Tax=Chlamydomonas eustigma TaxID=1157962 RepID=A0A250WS08_9CHLO|nr:hypothetical protein CEUSTIGMA_g931.t1 [Chlamydomonas eustigma]|eukprot:GAX73479.1 hypothetical protein CEUSTIGMA_g931.t1 [Chlamydomonas eustigma]
MVSLSRHDALSAGIWQPFAAAAVATSSCSDMSGSISRSLTHALSSCVIDDADGIAPLQREHSNQLLQRAMFQTRRARMHLDISSQPSQELPYTQDMATPVEQFPVEAISNMITDGSSRSPAPSPMHHPTKRHRPVIPTEAESDCASQDGVSQSCSQGDFISCRDEVTAGPTCRPPIPKGSSRRRNDQPRSSRKAVSSHEISGRTRSTHHPASLITHFAKPIAAPSASDPGASGPPCLNNVPWQQEKQASRLYHDYSVEKELGHGTFGVVYKAVHRQCGKAYAIKKSRKPAHSAADMQAWMDEVHVLAHVEGHPNIVTYYDSWAEPSGSGGEVQHIKMELCGESLRANVKSKVPMSNAELWEVMKQMASALNHTHDLGLAHLDIKPDNIYRALSTPDTFKLGDFGLATQKDGSKGISEGDARYLAPELLKNLPLPCLDKADMFALGATVYELATANALPAEGERWHAIREGRLMMLPAVSQQLQSLVKKLLSADPSARPDAASVLASCTRALSRQGSSSQMSHSQQQLPSQQSS